MSRWHRDNPELVDTPADPGWQPPNEPPPPVDTDEQEDEDDDV